MNKAFDESSVAPKERINIRYRSATGGATSEIELPLTLLIIGDMRGRTDSRPLESRPAIRIDKHNFNSVIKDLGLHLDLQVRNHLLSRTSDELSVSLDFTSMDDFLPDQIARQIPELHRLLQLREALVALKGPLGNIPAFRQRLITLLGNETSREQLRQELEQREPHQ